MIRFSCDWCRKDIKGKPERYALHQFCPNGDCKNKYRRFIEGKIEVQCDAAVLSKMNTARAVSAFRLLETKAA